MTISTRLLLNALSFWCMMIPAVVLGLVLGAIPGFSAANTIIIFFPQTFAMDMEAGLVFTVALYPASRMGAGIPAILVKIPDTAGGLLTTIVGLIVMLWLAWVSFFMHLVEMIVVKLLGISLIRAIAARHIERVDHEFSGLMIGFVGTDHVYVALRTTFDFLVLYGEIPLVPAPVGLFAVSEAFLVIEGESILTKRGLELVAAPSWAATFEDTQICVKRWWHVIWCSIVRLLEQFFLRAIRMVKGDIIVLFSSNLGNVLWLALVVSIALPYALHYKRRKAKTTGR